MRSFALVALLAIVVALPFVFRREPAAGDWKEGDGVLVIVTPDNEAIRREYAIAFSKWHQEKYGRPVRIDWRNIGGTSEIMRYLQGEYVSAFRAWWTAQGHPWRSDAAGTLLARSFDAANPPAGVAPAEWEERGRMRQAFRGTDDPAAFTTKLDLFFGGGAYDLGNAARMGMLVPTWPEGEVPPGVVADAETGAELFPAELSGETWRTDSFYGTTLSTFGICFNRDRMAALGIAEEPRSWRDLADPRWAGTLGLVDPTKSGSITKAFETIVQVECMRAVAAAGFGDDETDAWEAAIAAAGLPPGELPEGVPAAYQEAVEAGWTNGLRLVQRIAANARYFTDSAGKVPLDVGSGNAAAGVCIDFYGKFEAATANRGRPDGPMGYVTPQGESGVSCDPIGLLRGAPHRELARRFAEFCLLPEGQALWCYRAGEPGGPETYALQRFPIRRDFYPDADNPAFQAAYEEHRRHTTRDLGEPGEDVYRLAKEYRYRARWTAGHYGMLRLLVRAMGMDSGLELKAAWRAIRDAGGPDAVPAAVAALEAMPPEPEPLTWRSGLDVTARHAREELLRAWTSHFRKQYELAERLARDAAR